MRVDARMDRVAVRATRRRAIETRRSSRRLRYGHAVAMATIGPSTNGPVEAISEPTGSANGAPSVEFVSSAMERIFDVSMSLASVLGRLEPGTPETQQLAAAVAEFDLIMAGVRAWGSGRPFDWPDGPTRRLKVTLPVRPPSRGAPA